MKKKKGFQKYQVRKRSDQKLITRREPRQDYLKWFPVVMFWARDTYDLDRQDLEVMFFCRSERLFTKNKFNSYQNCLRWNKQRWDNLLDKGWIDLWEKASGQNPNVYELSLKGRELVDSIYRKLDGLQPICEAPQKTPMFKKTNRTYQQKVMRQQVPKFNKEYRELLNSPKVKPE